MRTKLSELRDALSIVINEKIQGEGASSSEIADEFIRREKRLLRLHHDEIERLAVMQLVNEVSRRRPSRSMIADQGDLFGDYAGPQSVVITAKGSHIKTRKSVLDLKIEEAVIYVQEHKKARLREARDAVEIDNLVERARPYCKADMTIRDGLRAADEAEKKA